MRSSDSFREFVLEQLVGVHGIRARGMFGGIGLYADDVFFGIVAADTLYFKLDDTSRRDYELAGVLEARDILALWATRAVAVAVRGTTKKSVKAPTGTKGTRTKSASTRARRDQCLISALAAWPLSAPTDVLSGLQASGCLAPDLLRCLRECSLR